jgi:hypothetical protein
MSQNNTIRLIFFSLWILFAVAQALFVELQGDEAYYWEYSEHLAWGYFDHPPVVAVLVKIGHALIQNELGVRLAFIVLITFTILILEKIVGPADVKLFYLLIASLAFLQLGMVFGGGMYAIPDFPLLFFTAVFLYLYKLYLEKPTFLVVLGVALSVTLMMLSKYHGVLVIAFIIFSNLSLLKKKTFWVVAIISVILFIPHVLWQIENHYPSLQFQLGDRNIRHAYSYTYIAEYIFTQPLIHGPLVGFVLVYSSFVFKPTNPFERGLKFLVIGIFSFFLLMSFRGRIEGNWTIMALIPLVYIGYKENLRLPRLRKVTWYLIVISIPLILIVRIILIGNLLPRTAPMSQLFGKKESILKMKERFGTTPLVFMNSYQQASLYHFYTKTPASSLNNAYGRYNQYSLWDIEDKLQSKDVVMVSNYKHPSDDSIKYGQAFYPVRICKNFRSYSNIQVVPEQSSFQIQPDDTLTLQLRFKSLTGSLRNPASDQVSATLVARYYQLLYVTAEHPLFSITENVFEKNGNVTVKIPAPPTSGEYNLFFGIYIEGFPLGLNSNRIKVIVK